MWIVSKKTWESFVKHVGTLNDELGAVQRDMTGMKSDLEWVKKLQWVVLIAVLGTFVTALSTIILKVCGVM